MYRDKQGWIRVKNRVTQSKLIHTHFEFLKNREKSDICNAIQGISKSNELCHMRLNSHPEGVDKLKLWFR